MTCTLSSNQERDQTCCAADQECCRVGPTDDPSTITVCCSPGTCVPGTGCVADACPGQRDCGGGVCVPTTDCCPAETRACYSGPAGTAGVGICRSGTQNCQGNGAFGACVGEILPQPETCNGLDDDCDGVVDEEVLCPGFETGELCMPDNFGGVRCCFHAGLPALLNGLFPDCDRCCSRDCNMFGPCE